LGAAFCYTKPFAQRCALIKKGRACFSQTTEGKEAQKGKKAREKAKQRVEGSQQARKFSQVCLLEHHDAKDNEHVEDEDE
jgi:hypothetical protein